MATYEFDQFLYSSDERIFRADFSLIFDFLTLIFTFISLSLVTRSLYRAQKLRYNFQKWHLQKFGKDSSAADASEFIDGWYIIIFVSDLAVIIGTILKVSFDFHRVKWDVYSDSFRSMPKQKHMLGWMLFRTLALFLVLVAFYVIVESFVILVTFKDTIFSS